MSDVKRMEELAQEKAAEVAHQREQALARIEGEVREKEVRREKRKKRVARNLGGKHDKKA